jgi:hypothetical protein
VRSTQPNTTLAHVLPAKLEQNPISEVKSHRAGTGHSAALVQQFVNRPDRGQYSVLLTAHPANGGQQSQLTIDDYYCPRGRLPDRR